MYPYIVDDTRRVTIMKQKAATCAATTCWDYYSKEMKKFDGEVQISYSDEDYDIEDNPYSGTSMDIKPIHDEFYSFQLEEKFSKKNFTLYSLHLQKNILFDIGFRVYSIHDYQTKHCYCPLSISCNRWMKLYGLHYSINDVEFCNSCTSMTPNSLTEHLKTKSKKCYYHWMVLKYLVELYGNW